MSSIAQSMEGAWVVWAAAGFSLVAAAVYLAIASPAVPADYKAPPRPVRIAAGVAYLVGGALILVADRRLLTLGAVLNPLVMAAYLAAAIKGHAAVDGLSLTGKAAQVALEVLLLWLVARPAESAVDLG
jgi:hypothetical protein